MSLKAPSRTSRCQRHRFIDAKSESYLSIGADRIGGADDDGVSVVLRGARNCKNAGAGIDGDGGGIT